MTWGMGRSARAPKNIQNVEQIYCAKEAFVAHLSDGTAIAWGEKERGGRIFDAGGSTLLRVQMIASTNHAFAAGLENKVVTWGWEKSGCVLPHEMELEIKNVKHIYSNPYAFVVIKEDGTPFAWGDPNRGGEIPVYLEPKLKNVYKIFSNDFAFVALLATGEVYTWGNKIFGGEIPENIHKQLKNVKNIFSTSFAFAALREDKKLLTWGHQHFGYSIQVSLQKQVFPDDPSIFGQESDLTPKKPRRRSTMGTGRMSQWDKFKTIVSDSKNSSPAAKRKNRRSSVKR
jgi:alpha-tubulin suppressor-like RCC1 family protein